MVYGVIGGFNRYLSYTDIEEVVLICMLVYGIERVGLIGVVHGVRQAYGVWFNR
jgi:hypothetical protein